LVRAAIAADSVPARTVWTALVVREGPVVPMIAWVPGRAAEAWGPVRWASANRAVPKACVKDAAARVRRAAKWDQTVGRRVGTNKVAPAHVAVGRWGPMVIAPNATSAGMIGVVWVRARMRIAMMIRTTCRVAP
jgi:hypothetical protein